MSDTVTSAPAPQTDAEVSDQLADILEELLRIRSAIDAEQQEIERLKVDSGVRAARTDVRLAALREQIHALENRKRADAKTSH